MSIMISVLSLAGDNPNMIRKANGLIEIVKMFEFSLSIVFCYVLYVWILQKLSILLHWHWGNDAIGPVTMKQPGRAWVNESHVMNASRTLIQPQ